MIKVLSGAVRESAHGINILLYGPPGSGKTEMTKVVAAAAGLTLYAVSEQSSWGGGEADRTERLATLVFAQQILKGTSNAALLFDEMEDVAWQFMKRGGSKAYLNRLLETNTVPILWTSNNIADIDPALLRRMTLAVELRLPPPVQRERILTQLSRRAGVALSEAEIAHLARRVDGTPAVLANALRAAKLSGGGAAAVEQAALGIQRAAFGIELRHAAPAAAFVPGTRLRQRGPRRPGGPDRRRRPPELLVLPVGTARHRQVGIRPLSRPAPQSRCAAQAGVRPARHVRR